MTVLTPVSKVVLASDGISMTLSNLDGNRDKLYMILLRADFATSPSIANTEIEMQFNGVNSYDSQRISGGWFSQASGDMSPSSCNLLGTSTDVGDAWQLISCDNARFRMGLGMGFLSQVGTHPAVNIIHTGVNDTAFNLTSLQFRVASGTFRAGTTKAWAWRVERFT